MKLLIFTKPVEKLTKKEIDYMNYSRIKEYGKGSSINFKQEDKKAIFIFVKENNKIVAFGMLKPVKIEFNGKQYNLLAMGRGMAIEKGKEYGRILSAARICYIKKLNKTALAFTEEHNLGFFEKSGFKIKRELIKRFAYKNPKTGKIIYDNEGHGVYYEGKDKFISKLLTSKGYAYMNCDFW